MLLLFFGLKNTPHTNVDMEDMVSEVVDLRVVDL